MANSPRFGKPFQPKAKVEPAKAQAESVSVASEQKEPVVTETRSRSEVKRRPFGVPTSRLSVGHEIEGYHLRWINDEPGRLHKAQQSGYQFVEPQEVGMETREDNRVKELVGVQRNESDPMFAYLMKIPQEWYEEDRDLANEQIDKLDNAIRSGNYERTAGDGRYVPQGGITYKT